MSAADRHNALARDFVQRVGRETGVPQSSNINALQGSGKEKRPTDSQRFQDVSFPPIMPCRFETRSHLRHEDRSTSAV